jgi:DNA-directed RNA polymerase subunit RPC12/RpoP
MHDYTKPRYQACPHCGSGEIHVTRWGGLLERCVLYLWGARPYRCRTCYKRFYMRTIVQGTASRTA